MKIHDHESVLYLYVEDGSSGIRWTLENFIGMIYVIVRDVLRKRERGR